LRKIAREDAHEIFFLRSDKRVLQFIDRDPARSVDEAVQRINIIDEAVINNESIAWAISSKNEPGLIGTIAFWNIKKEHYRAEMGYVLHPLFQGKGLMHEAMTVVLDYGSRVMNLHSVEANVNPDNLASIKLLIKNNFVREAYHKENYYFQWKIFRLCNLFSP
jgi:ribosomal-protein-alanine N-acetyltransferase